MNYCIYIILIIILIFTLYSLFDLKSLYNNNIVSSNVENFYQEVEINTNTMTDLLNKIGSNLNSYDDDIPDNKDIGTQSRLLDDYDTEWGSTGLNGESCLDIKYYVDNYGSHPNKVCDYEIDGIGDHNNDHYPKNMQTIAKNECARLCYLDSECISFMHSDTNSCILSSTCNENTAGSKADNYNDYTLYIKDKNKIEDNKVKFESDYILTEFPLLKYNITKHQKCSSDTYNNDDIISNTTSTTKAECSKKCNNLDNCTGFEFNYTGENNEGNCVLRETCNKYGCLEDDNSPDSTHKKISVYTKENNNFPEQPLCSNMECSSMIKKYNIYEKQFLKLYTDEKVYIYINSEPLIISDIIDKVKYYTVSQGLEVKLYSSENYINNNGIINNNKPLTENIYKTPVSVIDKFSKLKSFEIVRLGRT